MTTTASYGHWESPISAELIVQGAVRFGNIELDGGCLYWNELRPTEAGRSVICRQNPDGSIDDLTPEGYSVRTRVHEYGGGSFTVSNGTTYFSNFADQRVYVQKGESVAPLTPEGYRFADMHACGTGLLAIGEVEAEHEPDNFLALIDEDGTVTRLATGHDFYASIAVHQDQIAWLTWDHPDLPWNGTELWTGRIVGEELVEVTKIAGGRDESIFQPQWSPDGTLYYVSDKSNWWNFYSYDGNDSHCLCAKDAEFGLPQWVFRMSTWAFCGDQILCAYTQSGDWCLATLNPQSGELRTLDLGYNVYSQVRCDGNMAAFFASSSTNSSALISLDLASNEVQLVRRSSEAEVSSDYVSPAKSISFPSAQGRTAHAFLYLPKNPDYQAPEGELPPLIVQSHGGPTAATSGSLSLKTQFWTSRGFTVLDVNYGGSTGYGRDYRNLLDDAWGIVDVEDCCAGAQYLVDQGLVDSQRLAITGGSAGGFTTMACLAFKDVFTVGASYFGVSDLEALARDTHKFESRYLDRLVGPYPERKDIYVERSPIHHVEKLACPMIFFQGMEDKVVPPNQAEMMVEALRKKGVLVEYVTYETEQHGFRQAENIKDALRNELAFYLKVFAQA